MKQILIIAAAVMLLASCSRHGRYESNGDVVRYTYWTFSFGYMSDTLPDADPATFQSVNEWLGHDASRVFFKEKLVPGADPATLKANDYPLYRDKNDYYYKATPMRVADVATFKVLKRIEDSFWAKDSQHAYFDTTRIEGVDLPTFKVKSQLHAVDKNHVYYLGQLLPQADPATYDADWKGFYSRDKSHIWFLGELVEDADYETFTVDNDNEAHDKNGKFHGPIRVN
ncbi:MAG: DKNYY domain-containing protein [Muribaculaceae bacterium]|nr:DKNYY domain-containing protein [Muribaculaceae bacterium]